MVVASSSQPRPLPTPDAPGGTAPDAAAPPPLPPPNPAKDDDDAAAAAAAAAALPQQEEGKTKRTKTKTKTKTKTSTAKDTRADKQHRRNGASRDEDNSNQRTRNQFRSRAGKGGNTSYQLRQYAEATLGGGSLRKVVKLPEGEDENEWLAVNMVDFYNQINLLYGAITEFCSPQSCPEMKATDEFEYLWQDGETYKRPTKMAAPAYIEQLMGWVQGNIDNEAVLPSRIGVPFPKSFPSLVRQIFKRLYRVYAHIYCHHYPVIRELGLEPHLNTSFKQYVLFIDEHGLASGKDYWGPLGDLVESMLRSD